MGAPIDDELFSAARDDLLTRVSTRPDAIAAARRELRYGVDLASPGSTRLGGIAIKHSE